MPNLSVFLVGLSGPASAGKTTLAHLLSYVFSPRIKHILHGDDFCKEIEQIPIVNGYPDADGPAGVDFDRMGQVIDHVSTNGGNIPTDFKSWQADVFPGQDTRALGMVNRGLLEELKNKVAAHSIQNGGEVATRMVIIEGFMLYNIPEIRDRLDCRLFVRLSHKEAKHRRMTRPQYGIEAKEGEFWKTEDYFEEMVWRNYVEQHSEFFEGGDVQGKVDEVRCKDLEVVVQDGIDVDVETTLRWAVDAILEAMRRVYQG